jgi:hypothetical protein
MTYGDGCEHIRCVSYRTIGDEQGREPKVSGGVDPEAKHDEKHEELPQEIITSETQLKCVPSGNSSTKWVQLESYALVQG